MKHLSLLALALLLSLDSVSAAPSVDETKSADIKGFVTVSVVRGTVDVIGWDKAEVRVSGKLDEETEEFIFEVDGDETRIEVEIDDDKDNWYERSRGSELTIHVPHASQLEIGGVSLDVSVNELTGEIDVGVVSGDVTVGVGDGDVDLNSVSGDVRVSGRKGKVEAASVSGDIKSEDNSGGGEYASVSGDIVIINGGSELHLETVSGDITVKTTSVIEAEGQSVSGDIQFMSDISRNASIELESISGSIDLALGGNVDARFSIETGSGNIRNRLSDDKPHVSKYMRNENLRFSMGKGSSHVEVSTQSGDITLTTR